MDLCVDLCVWTLCVDLCVDLCVWTVCVDFVCADFVCGLVCVHLAACVYKPR